jgi:hypothetical protein
MNHSVIDSSFVVSTNGLYYCRLFMFLFCTFTYVSDFVSESTDSAHDAADWFKYLTHWSAMNLIIYFGLASWYSLAAIKNPSRSTLALSSSKLACFVHFMFELSSVTAWFVSILYWTALYPIEKNPPQGYFYFLNVCKHGVPALFMAVDLFLGSGVLVQFHLSMVYAYFIAYLIVNAIYTTSTLNPIYDILTYQDEPTVVWVAISLALVVLIWGLTYLLIRLRTRCCTRNRAKSVVVFSKDPNAALAV